MDAYIVLAKHPISVICYVLMILAFVSMWIYRRFWIWGSLAALSYLIGMLVNTYELITLAPIIILLICYLALREDIRSFGRFFAVTGAAIVSFGLKFHLIRGFNNILLIPDWKLSADSTSFNWYLNFDTPFIALFPLAFCLPLLKRARETREMFIVTLPWAALTLILLFGLSLYLSIIKFHVNLPLAAPIWLVVNLFSTVIVEEVFYRGVLQHEIVRGLANSASPILAILIVSLLFAVAHLTFVTSFRFAIAAFFASLLYGSIYQFTGRIESSILTHYAVNITHFFLFSYPALSPSIHF